MAKTLFLAFLSTLGFVVPAFADATSDGSQGGLNLGFIVAVIFGAIWSAMFAYQAFTSPQIPLQDLPTPPRYMARRSQFRFGAASFVLLSVLIFAFIVLFYQQLVPFIRILNPHLADVVEATLDNSHPNYFAVAAFAAAAIWTAVSIESKWNPVWLARSVINSWVSIPHLADDLMSAARNSIQVPAAAIKDVLAWPDVAYVADVDFTKNRQSLDRIWAECCYMVLWLGEQSDFAAHQTFFNEPSFTWPSVNDDFHAAGLAIGSVKEGKPDKRSSEIAHRLADGLHKKLCRLVACFLVYKNDSDSRVFEEARAFGIGINPTQRANPLPYIVVYIGGIVVAIFAGVTLSSAAFDFVTHGSPLDTVINHSDLIARWIFFGGATYGAPIIFILAARYLGWRNKPLSQSANFNFYFLTVVVAFPISVLALAIIQKFFGSHDARAKEFLDLVLNALKWGIGASILAAYVVYNVDCHIDALAVRAKFKIGSLLRKLGGSVGFGIVLMLVVLLQAMTAESADKTWQPNKLHIVILGTTFTIGFVAALIAHFSPYWLAHATPEKGSSPSPDARNLGPRKDDKS